MAAPTPTLTCKQCNYENEPERVYCHNCGAKLDRTLLPKEPTKGKETADASRKRVRKLVSPRTGFFTNWHTSLFNALFASVVVAALIQAVRVPAGVPKMPTKDDLLGAQGIMENIEDVQMSHSPESRQLPQAMINLYLANAIKSGNTASGDYFVFNRAFVSLGKDVIQITNQESAFGYPLYAASSYKLSIAGGKIVAANVGGAIGRLPIHPMVMDYCADYFFDPLWKSLAREKSLMDGMASINISPGVFTFTTKPHP
jgi:hypothetical protein